MKRLTALLCAIIILASLGITAHATDSAQMTIRANQTTAYRGNTLDFSVSISTVEDCRSAAFMLVYDSSVFEFVSGSCTLSGTALANFSSGTGTFAFGSGTTVSGTIFTFRLKIKDNAPFGSYTIGANVNTRDSAGDIPTTVNKLTIQVACDHIFSGWTCVGSEPIHFRECSVCGLREEGNHQWVDLRVEKSPTCKDTGTIIRQCNICRTTKTDVLEKTKEHHFGRWVKVDDATHKHTCSVCAKEESAAHEWDAGTVTKKPTCIAEGEKQHKCVGCGAVKTVVVQKTTTHNYGKWVKTDDATHKHTCADCAKEESAAHTWDKGTVTKKATCKDEGVMTYTCTGCGAAKTERIPLSSTHTYNHCCDTGCNICGAKRTTTHSYRSTYSQSKQEHWLECRICGSKKDTAQHIPGDAATEQAPQTCTVCGYMLAPALTHTHQYAQVWSSDEQGHWYPCEGCEEYGSYEDHVFENDCDTGCDICGYAREITHIYAENWEYNGVGHWQSCTVCGAKTPAEDHLAGADATATTAQTCQICGCELAPALGTEPAPETTAPAAPPAEEDPDSGSYPWWILLLILIATALGAYLYLNRKKK